MILDTEDEATRRLIVTYANHFALPTETLCVTTSKRTFEGWLGRRVGSSLGGAYAFSQRKSEHYVLINLPRIDRTRPKALEIVVVEELMHMRDRLDGDLRRHAKHGYDRIAHRVASMTGTTLEDVRSCLLPAAGRPPRYLYGCPTCGMTVRRHRRGTWSCGRCSPRFNTSLVLRLLTDDLDANQPAS